MKDIYIYNKNDKSKIKCFKYGKLEILRDSSTGQVLGVLHNSHYFESPQDYLPKTKPYVYRGTRASRMLRVPLRLVKMCVFMERWPGHSSL